MTTTAWTFEPQAVADAVDLPTAEPELGGKELRTEHKIAVKRGLAHPAPTALRQLALESQALPQDTLAALRAHVASCARCTRTLAIYTEHEEYIRAVRPRVD